MDHRELLSGFVRLLFEEICPRNVIRNLEGKKVNR
jgi:hypothetical protein